MKKFEVYEDANNEWRWRLTTFVFGKTKIIASSGEGYQNKADCIKTIYSICSSILNKEYSIEDGAA
jgi:uncharacterized protein YegP (UPF0339 family)